MFYVSYFYPKGGVLGELWLGGQYLCEDLGWIRKQDTLEKNG